MGTVITLLIDLAYALYKYLRNWKVDNVVIIHDDLDRFLASRGLNYNAVTSLVGLYANLYEGGPAYEEKPWGDKFTVTYIALSDWGAVELSDKYKMEGLLHSELIWNLPKEEYLDLVREVANKLGAPYVDEELIWQLLGGNVRALIDLAITYKWDINPWIDTNAIKPLGEALNEEGTSKSLTTEYVLTKVIGDAKHVEPDELMMNTAFNTQVLTRRNIMITITGAWSELPTEPWVGKYGTYQLPIYYWTLLTMVRRGMVNVDPDDVVNTIMKLG